MDLRTVVLEVPTQDVISRDNVSVKVSAVVYLRVIDAEKAIIQVVDYLNATSQLAQTMLRSVLGKHQLDEMLAEREKLNLDIQQALDAQTDSWGIKVANVEIKQVDLTESMIRAIARQAEAERERRAKVIHAEGELQASEKLFQAAKILAQEPQAIQLRYLETLTVIGADKNTTIVFPLPMDLVAPFFNARLKPRPDRQGVFASRSLGSRGHGRAMIGDAHRRSADARAIAGDFLAIVIELREAQRVLHVRALQRLADDRLAAADFVVALFHRQFQVEDRVPRVALADPACDERGDA